MNAQKHSHKHVIVECNRGNTKMIHKIQLQLQLLKLQTTHKHT